MHNNKERMVLPINHLFPRIGTPHGEFNSRTGKYSNSVSLEKKKRISKQMSNPNMHYRSTREIVFTMN